MTEELNVTGAYIFVKDGIHYIHVRDMINIGKHYYFDVLCGVMDVGPKNITIYSEVPELEDVIRFEYNKVAYNTPEGVKIIEPSYNSGTQKKKVSSCNHDDSIKAKVYKYIYTADD